MNKDELALLDDIIKPYCQCVTSVVNGIIECKLHDGIRKHLNGLEFERGLYAKQRDTLRNRTILSEWVGVADSRYPIYLESLNIESL